MERLPDRRDVGKPLPRVNPVCPLPSDTNEDGRTEMQWLRESPLTGPSLRFDSVTTTWSPRSSFLLFLHRTSRSRDDQEHTRSHLFARNQRDGNGPTDTHGCLTPNASPFPRPDNLVKHNLSFGPCMSLYMCLVSLCLCLSLCSSFS